MKNINTIFIIISFIFSIGCTPNEKSLYDIIDKSLQQAKPTLLFVSNPSLGNYKHFNSILKDEQVQKVLTNFHTKIICAVLVYNGCFYFVFMYSLSQ